jgi:hypothetical protein
MSVKSSALKPHRVNMPSTDEPWAGSHSAKYDRLTGEMIGGGTGRIAANDCDVSGPL